MTNIRDIAARAGVSIATVSHVFNETRPVQSETRERVLLAARELDYQPNMVARSLRRRHTQTIGLIVADIDTPYFSDLVHAVEAVTSARGYNVILCNSGDNGEREAHQVEMLFSRQVDGLLLIPAAGNHSHLKGQLRRGSRIVLVNRYVHGLECPAVVADDDDAAFGLTTLLLEKGHRRIGAASWVEGVSTYENRWKGVIRALESYGLSEADLTWRFRGSAHPKDGQKAADELASLKYPPTAVICFNSLIRDGMLLGLFSVAPDIVHRIEITGFGYSALARVAASSRHYVEQPSHKIGALATAYLLDSLCGAQDWTPSDRILVRTRLAEYEPVVGSDFGDPAGSSLAVLS